MSVYAGRSLSLHISQYQETICSYEVALKRNKALQAELITFTNFVCDAYLPNYMAPYSTIGPYARL